METPRRMLTVEDLSNQPGYHTTQSMAPDASMAFLKREVKAGVYDTYAVSSALLAGFGVCTIAIEHGYIAQTWKVDKLRYFALLIHQVLLRFSTALSLFSMLIFSLSTMYAKTALSRKHYSFELYDWFARKTAVARQSAFWCMYTSCILYMASISLSFFYSLHAHMAILATSMTLAVLLAMLYHTNDMMNNAGMLFAPDEALRAILEKDEPDLAKP